MPLPVIPPLVLWTLGALGAAAFARLIAKEYRRINAELEQARIGAAVIDKDMTLRIRRDRDRFAEILSGRKLQKIRRRREWDVGHVFDGCLALGKCSCRHLKRRSSMPAPGDCRESGSAAL